MLSYMMNVDSVRWTEEIRDIDFTDSHFFKERKGVDHRERTSLMEDATRLQQDESLSCL
jgi:hypothetical protein